MLLDPLDLEAPLDLLVLLVRMVCLACLDLLDLLDLVDVLERWDLLVLPDLLDLPEHQVPLVVDLTLASSPSLKRRPLIPSACSVLMMLMFSVTVTWRWTAL